MKYRADRGGHAPGHLRDAMEELVWARYRGSHWWDRLADGNVLSFYDPAWQATWEAMPTKQRAHWLTGQLWNCSDIAGRDLCDMLEMEPGQSQTYATIARHLRGELVEVD